MEKIDIHIHPKTDPDPNMDDYVRIMDEHDVAAALLKMKSGGRSFSPIWAGNPKNWSSFFTGTRPKYLGYPRNGTLERGGVKRDASGLPHVSRFTSLRFT